MLSESIQIRLAERFAAPLPDFHDRRIVFWHDEDGEFATLADELALPNVSVLKLTGKNNFAVKKLLTEDDLKGNYLVYNPLAYTKTQDNWLLDIELYSEEFRADLVSMQMEELRAKPSPDMSKTVKLYARFLENKERKSKLQKNYQTPLQLHIDILAILCGLNGGSAQDVIIAVLEAGLDKKSNAALENIRRFGNLEAFWKLVQKYTGYVDDDKKPLNLFASHVLVTALSQTMPSAALKGLERFVSDSCKTYCYSIVYDWVHQDNVDGLYRICRQIERELQLANRFDGLETKVLLTSDVFPAINESILKRFFAEIGEQVIKPDILLKIVENRRTAVWHKRTAGYFDCLYHVARMQEFYLEHVEGFHIVEPKALWEMYCKDGYRMDACYRHFHHAFGNMLTNSNHLLEDGIKKTAETVEGLYHNWYLKELTAVWTNTIADDMAKLGYVSEVPRQREFYNRYNLGKGSRAFVIISDALRYEVASELTESLNRTSRGKAELESMQAIFPTTTRFGMAALLPGQELSTVCKNNGIEVFIDNKGTDDTVKREVILQATNPASVAVSYKDLLRMKQQERRDLTTGKDVIYIYHNTIDAIGDKAATETKVFEACAAAVQELTNIVRVIVNELSGTNIFITADHGFLYTYNPLNESQKISSQSFAGEVYEVGRRYALVEPTTDADLLLPVNTSRGIQGVPMKGYAPRETIRIRKPGGGENYVHGGVSLQEMVVPVVVYKNIRASQKRYVEVKNPGLALLSESRKVSNLIFSLDFLQKSPIGDKVQPCTYDLYFTTEDGVSISDRKTVIANRADSSASERVFRMRFNLKSMTYDRNKVYRLVIASESDVPEEIEFYIDIAFADDFGFDL
jgi:uncharacterized protein (TIGR02687 family)